MRDETIMNKKKFGLYIVFALGMLGIAFSVIGNRQEEMQQCNSSSECRGPNQNCCCWVKGGSVGNCMSYESCRTISGTCFTSKK